MPLEGKLKRTSTRSRRASRRTGPGPTQRADEPTSELPRPPPRPQPVPAVVCEERERHQEQGLLCEAAERERGTGGPSHRPRIQARIARRARASADRLAAVGSDPRCGAQDLRQRRAPTTGSSPDRARARWPLRPRRRRAQAGSGRGAHRAPRAAIRHRSCNPGDPTEAGVPVAIGRLVDERMRPAAGQVDPVRPRRSRRRHSAQPGAANENPGGHELGHRARPACIRTEGRHTMTVGRRRRRGDLPGRPRSSAAGSDDDTRARCLRSKHVDRSSDFQGGVVVEAGT